MYKTIMDTKKQRLTSVKIDEDLFDDFKVDCIKMKFSLQKLTERCIHRYMNDKDFRKEIHNYKIIDSNG